MSATQHNGGALSQLLDDKIAMVRASVLLILAGILLQGIFRSDKLAGIPIIGEGTATRRRKLYMSGAARDLYMEGYKKYKDGLFRIATTRRTESIVVSPKFLPELRKLPDDVLSFSAAIGESMQSKYTKIRFDVAALPHTVKSSLTPALPRLNSILAAEVVDTMRLELPQTHTWTVVSINEKLLRILAMASGRIFVGPELCRDEAYLDAAINYTVDLVTAVHVVSFMPVWLRPILAPWAPSVRKLETRIREADQFLRPIIHARRMAELSDPDYQKPEDMLQWLMDSQTKFGEKQDKELAEWQLEISFAAIHTTTLTATNAFYTLAAMPELIPELREDVQQALEESKGEFTSFAMQNMRKLDSFLKEVLRFHVNSSASFERKVLKPFSLSNGQVIPAGVVIELPQVGIYSDPALFDDPDKFDAMRFYRLRQTKVDSASGIKAAEVVANSQFVSVGSSSLTFGAGKHACPGRFFAANELKMLLAETLMHYEIKNPDGIAGRHENLIYGPASVPDPTKTIMMRKL